MKRATAVFASSILVGLGTRAWADVPAPSRATSRPAESPGAQERAAALFERGLRSFESLAFEMALDDFRKSLELYPTPSAMKNAALCLRELERFDEALELVEAMPARFPDLSAEELRSNQERVDELSSQVAWVELHGASASSHIAVDGRERGTLPPSARVRVSRGSHRLRVTAEGMVPTEIPVVAIPGQTTTVDLDQRPLVASSTKPWTVDVEIGGLVTPALGGEVGGCSSCDRGLGVGGRIVGHAGRELTKMLFLSLDAGYLALGQDIEARQANATAVGNVNNPGIARDALSMRGALLGLSLAYRVPSTIGPFVRVGLGAFFGSVQDDRSGTLRSAVGAPYDVLPLIQRQPAQYGYLSFAFGIAIRPTAAFRIGAGLDAMGMLALRQPHWDADCGQACTIPGGPDGDARFSNEALAGRFVALVSPFVDAGYAF